MAHDPLKIIESADVGQPAEALEGLQEGPIPNLDKLPDGVVSGSTLIDFSGAANPVIRSSVSLALLFASRVATTAVTPEDDADDWLAHYTQTLSMLGFRISGYGVVNSKFSKTGVAVHKAIIPFLTIAFGGAAVGPIILQGLKSLQEIDPAQPWITLFDRQTRRFDAHEMHFAAVSANETETVIRYAVARLHVAEATTQILFFKIDKASAEFQSATTTMTADNSLLAAAEPKLRDKLAALIASSIDAADIGT